MGFRNSGVFRKALLLSLVFSSFLVGAVWAADPTGAKTIESNPGLAVDFVWVLLCGFLVMFMQAGFACVEAGFCRSKNSTNLMMKNLLDFVMGCLAFWAMGYAILMGKDWHGLIGTSGFFLAGKYYDVQTYLSFFWQLVFCATAATIVSGAVAERLKFSAYLIYSIVVSAFIYPVYAHWVWGGGWLSKLPFGLGHVDFAGSGVVHAIGGIVGLAGAIALGPRYGRFDKEGNPRPIPGHNIPLAALGVFILWFGWYGFNPGSTFSAHHLRISIIAVNTTLAAAAASLTAMLIVYAQTKKFDIGIALNGVLAGLVAITAPCAWVESWAAVVIGVIAGIILVIGTYLLEWLKIDDPVGAVPVHGFNGLWGIISVGIFADGTYGIYSIKPPFVKGLLYGGGFGQLLAQLIGAVALFAWAFTTAFILFKVMDAIMGIRVSPEEELHGLDIPEHGTPAYPEFITLRRR